MTKQMHRVPLDLRIVGSSAGVFIKSCPWIGSVDGVCTLQERFTVTFVSDGRTTSLRDRRISEVELLELRDFLRAATTEDLPHISVAKFETASGVLNAAVVEGDAYSLILEFSARSYFGDGDTDTDGIGFSLPRGALWEAFTALDERLGLAANLPDDLSGLEG